MLSTKVTKCRGMTDLACCITWRMSTSVLAITWLTFGLPVQTVIRPHQDFRGFAGQIASGSIMPGEEVVILPSGKTSRIKAVVSYEGDLLKPLPATRSP